MSAAVDAGPYLRRRSEVVYRRLEGKKWRSAVVWIAYSSGGGRAVKILYTRNGKDVVAENVLVDDRNTGFWAVEFKSCFPLSTF